MKKLLSWLMALMIALVPLLATAESPEDELNIAYQAAMKLYEEKRIEEAFAQLLVLADKGYAEAMYSIGDIYFEGEMTGGVPDYQLTKEWYLKAADAGNAAAMFALASDYANGYYTDGVPDYQLAKEWYQKAAEAGDARAAYMMGYHCERGSFTGVPDYEEAMMWWLKAAEQMQPNALYAIGRYYAHDAEPIDFEKARVWLEKAAAAGYMAAAASLGHHYYSGDFAGDTPDYAKALVWYENAVAQGYTSNSSVYDRLGWIYAGNSDAMEADYMKALEAYTAGAELGSGYSMAQIGALYRDGRLGEADKETAAMWFSKAVEAGYADAQDALDALGN